ncbi:LysR family transcriptional regulator [Methylobacterium sp. WL103]|uniref:LysR substrate-binding domain-containing protein n=1 Tax=Methylobacterium sp. WL103 TaxID=2603891 RepID=UPI0011C7065A|nr:LysR substrate-binding domain-containing protein [Methylobacterium sp. WL103]TXN06680.1 LysR family transcriptional regulator [Methylobacterium sp. WL103]
MRRLPPLHALRVFEVAARAGSHAAAAAELGLTHGAVSRQVAVLEAWFGQRLFVRVGRSVVPTPAARAFAEAVSLTFDRLDAAAEICGRPLAPRILRVSTPTTFAMRWLIPRLDSFHAARKEAEVVVTTTTTLHNALRGGFDLAVRREPRIGTGAHHPWGAYRAVPFLREANTLVASPSLLAARPLRTPDDLEGATLLSSETRPGDWSDWLGTAGLLPDTGSRRTFDHYFVALQATADGLGYGLGPLPVLSDDLASGRLVAPFPEIVVPRPGYVTLVPNDADKTSTLTAFVDWLVATGAQ